MPTLFCFPSPGVQCQGQMGWAQPWGEEDSGPLLGSLSRILNSALRRISEFEPYGLLDGCKGFWLITGLWKGLCIWVIRKAVFMTGKKKWKTEIQRVKTHHHVCVEGHMLKGKKRVTRLKYICIRIYMHLGEQNRMYIHIKDETLNEGLRRGGELRDGRINGHFRDCDVCRLGGMYLSHKGAKFPGRHRIRLIEQCGTCCKIHF